MMHQPGNDSLTHATSNIYQLRFAQPRPGKVWQVNLLESSEEPIEHTIKMCRTKNDTSTKHCGPEDFKFRASN